MEMKQLFLLMEKFEKSGLSEMCFKQNGEEVCLKKPSAAQPQALTAPIRVDDGYVQGQVRDRAAGERAPAQAQRSSEVEVIRAPLVGTFYRAAAPDAHAFVEAGDKVKKGQTLCILEAMKLMNEFQADFDMEILGVLAENGTMVEFGSPLFEVRRA